jgi:hypothetical protein
MVGDTGMPTSAVRPTPVTTQVPPLRMASTLLGDVAAVGHPDTDDARIGPLPVGERCDDLAGLGHGLRRVGRPQLEGVVSFELDGVDGHDHRGAGVAGTLHGVDPDPAHPHHDHDIPGRTPAELTADPQPVSAQAGHSSEPKRGTSGLELTVSSF